MTKRTIYIDDTELDKYQLKVINADGDNDLIVTGCAGSGKSILALWKAKDIADCDKGSFIFIVYTNALKKYIEDGIKALELNPTSVITINKCYSWARQSDNRPQRKGWRIGNFDYILVDEAQDMTPSQIKDIMEHANKAVLLYGDSAQQLYKKTDGSESSISMEEIKNMTGYRSDELLLNHRLPRKIAQLAEVVNPNSEALAAHCIKEGEELPYILRFPSFEAQLDFIAETIISRRFDDVGILFSKNDDVRKAHEYYELTGFAHEYRLTNRDDVLNFESQNPKIMTYHSSKGLQFGAVFLPNCNCPEYWLNPLYVAMTRAYQCLYILHSGDLSELFDSVDSDLYVSSLDADEDLL